MKKQWRFAAGVILATATLAACDGEGPASLTDATGNTGGVLFSSEEVCETINFSEFVTAHNTNNVTTDDVKQLSVHDVTLAVSAFRYLSGGTVDGAYQYPVVIDGAGTHPEDLDLTAGGSGFCADCADLGSMLIIEDPDGFTAQGDSRWGGEIEITGFGASAYDLYLTSVTFVDIDTPQDPPDPAEVLVDGLVVVAAVPQADGDGKIQVKAVDKEVGNTLTLVLPYDQVSGWGTSGAFDDLVVCRDEPTNGGGQGCTPGYWRQSHHYVDWINYDPNDLFVGVFDNPGSLARPEHNVNVGALPLGEAVQLRGGGVNALMRHTVAALLNAANPAVNYDYTEQQVIDKFNSAIVGSDADIENQKDDFAGLNEQGCPL